MADTLEHIKNEAMRIEEDSIHSAKAYFNVSEQCKNMHYLLGIPSALLAAIASGSAFNKHEVIAGCLSIAVTALTALITFVNPNGKAATHKSAGDAFLRLRNQARCFYQIELPNLDTPKSLAKIAELAKMRDELNGKSPIIPRWAFEKARKGIVAGEAKHQIDGGA